jgi:hypothetical protein
MNLETFAIQYQSFDEEDQIVVSCDSPECDRKDSLQKRSAYNNVARNGRFLCRSCSYTDEGKAKIGAATSYPRSDETKAKMSAAKKAYFTTDAGKEFKRRLSIMTALGHTQNKYENAKRQGWYPSTKTGKWMFFGSSYELRLCWLLDQDENVETYETQIGYQWEGRGRCLDFLVTFVEGSKKAIEVKPADRLTEEAFVQQLADSEAHARSNGWEFEVNTEKTFSMTYQQIRDWADKYRETITGIDYTAHRMEMDRKKAKKHYDAKIATDTVSLFCTFCNVEHTALRLTHDKNIKRNGRYICEREGGHIAGSKPKKKKENPHAAEGKKKCNRCEQVKLLEEFGDDKMKSDGKATRCKECRAEVATAKYREKTSEKTEQSSTESISE